MAESVAPPPDSPGRDTPRTVTDPRSGDVWRRYSDDLYRRTPRERTPKTFDALRHALDTTPVSMPRDHKRRGCWCRHTRRW